MNSSQRSYLKRRLETVRNTKPWHYDRIELSKPQKVVEAEKRIERDQKLIEEFKDRQQAATDRRRAAISSAYGKCYRLIELEDSKAALAAIDKFEATKF